jgi:hypothetical protein
MVRKKVNRQGYQLRVVQNLEVYPPLLENLHYLLNLQHLRQEPE